MAPKIRKRITFTGWVQGVGFRYREVQAARLYGATGWVQNQWDGSVLMEIQGTEASIDAVLLAIERGHYIAIDRMRVKTLPLLEETDFVVRDDG